MIQELKLYTLANLIGSNCQINEETITITNIVIPRIQRDYAQGRCGKAENRVRERFLDVLYDAIKNKKVITLDFVYGDVENETLTLLDGQQRLTTLFLLHWYAAKKRDVSSEEYEFLNHFSYETRFSSRDFCNAIVKNEISFDCEKLSEEIKNQAWYPYDWKNDPTIQSMLVMIDAINEKFSDIENLWTALISDNLITFYFLPLKEMGLSDELYIKMNSRGKPLTDFEHFKAEFLEIIKEQDENLHKRLSQKIDTEWTDVLFPYRGDNHIIDDEFMRYFKYVSHILCYKNDIRSADSEQKIENDEFKLAKLLYSKGNEKSIENLKYLESAFDCWKDTNINDFFNSIFYTVDYERGKTKLYQSELNLFKHCCEFDISLKDRLLFYAVLLYKLNETSIESKDFKRRIRIVRNLTENSQYEIREFDQYGNNQMQRLLLDVDKIICEGIVVTEDRGFNTLQKQEEQKKIEWEKLNSKYSEELYKLEDHNLLKGTISIIGVERPENFSKFRTLFNGEIDKDLISKSMLSIGDYSQKLGWKFQLGVKSNDTIWSDLFHPTKQRNEDNRFQNTSKILNELLSKLDENKDIEKQLETLVNSYLNNNDTQKDWHYYFVKYDEMRYDTHGMHWWYDKINKPYEIVIMHTEKTMNGKNWNAFAYTLAKLYPDKFEFTGNFASQGDKLRIKGKDFSVNIFNDRFEIQKDGQTKHEIKIPQENGIDLEDRIEKIIEFLQKEDLSS